MIHAIENFRKLNGSFYKKHRRIQSIDTKQRKNRKIFPLPIMSVHKEWKGVGIKIWIILSVLNKRLHSNPSLSSVLLSVDLNSGLMQMF